MTNLLDFIKETDFFQKIEVNELLFVEYKCMVDESKFGIWSDQNYLVYVTTGKKMWRSAFQDYIVDPGQIIFVKKGANLAHQYFDDDFCCLLFFIPDQFIQNFTTRNTHLFQKQSDEASIGDSIIMVENENQLSTYFDSVLHYFSSGAKPDKRLLEIKFEELLFHLVAQQQNYTINNYFKSLGLEKSVTLRMVIEENFSYNLKMEEYARLCAMSLSAFKRLFSTVYSESPGKWLSKKRLEYSRQLLLSTDKDINQVAFESGFENTSHYIRLFKTNYQITPNQYRLTAVS